MRTLATIALTAALASPALCADLMITKTKHADAMKGREAKDVTETTWLGKDRMRIEEGDKITIVRTDLKKLFLLDTKSKTVSTLDLPIDIKKYLPADMAPTYEAMMSSTKITVTPTTETKKIHDWNATKYTMNITMPMPGPMAQGQEMTITQEIWATKDVQLERAAWLDMQGAMLSMGPGGAAMATEMKKVDGYPILIERTQSVMGQEMKSKEEVTAIASKDAPEGSYDVPKDYTEKPFDPRSGGMGQGGRRGGKPADAGGEKKDGEKKDGEKKEGDKPEKKPVPEPK
jgi:hypothetical protein